MRVAFLGYVYCKEMRGAFTGYLLEGYESGNPRISLVMVREWHS